MKRTKVKVLENTLQFDWEWEEEYSSKESLQKQFLLHSDIHEVIFNRVGWYCQGEDCWYEFKSKDGSFTGISADREIFLFRLQELNDGERLLNWQDWHFIKKLLTKGLIAYTPQFKHQSRAEVFRTMEQEMRKITCLI